jgi:hypothetical protein
LFSLLAGFAISHLTSNTMNPKIRRGEIIALCAGAVRGDRHCPLRYPREKQFLMSSSDVLLSSSNQEEWRSLGNQYTSRSGSYAWYYDDSFKKGDTANKKQR